MLDLNNQVTTIDKPTSLSQCHSLFRARSHDLMYGYVMAWYRYPSLPVCGSIIAMPYYSIAQAWNRSITCVNTPPYVKTHFTPPPHNKLNNTMLRQSIIKATRPAARAFATTSRAMGAGDTGSVRPGGQAYVTQSTSLADHIPIYEAFFDWLAWKDLAMRSRSARRLRRIMPSASVRRRSFWSSRRDLPIPMTTSRSSRRTCKHACISR